MDSPTFPVGTLPPPTLARPEAPPNLISQAPALPRVVASVPPPAASAAMPFATSLNPAPPPRPAGKKQGGAARRFVSWMLLLAAIGGIAFAAITYGPDLMDRADDAVDEPEAPMSFPVVGMPPGLIRTATYTVERASGDDSTSYTVTTDFETGLSYMTLDRADHAKIEMMAVFDGAIVRRADQPTWYQLERGEFPLDSWQGRSRWVRTFDELLPLSLRSLATIERSTESSVEGVPTRRLLVTIDPSQLRAALTPPAVEPATAPDAAVDPAADPTVDPAVDPAATTPAPAPALAPGIVLAADADLTVPLEIELWIDDSGIVRKVILPPALGGETVTVTSVSSEAFELAFPTAEQVQPMTAAALLSLDD